MKYWSGPRTYLETPKNYTSVGFISVPPKFIAAPIPPPISGPPLPPTIVNANYDWPNPQPVWWYQSWTQRFPTTQGPPPPPNQFDWPLPQTISWYQSWTQRFQNPNPPPPPLYQADWPLPKLPIYWDLFVGFRLQSLTSNIELREDLSAELLEDTSVELRE